MDVSKSRKEMRFVLNVEQVIPLLDRIRDTISIDSDEQNGSDCGDSFDDVTKINELALAPERPAITSVATSTSIALPNIYEEYVNFIDLSVLNPIVDARHCQRDRLIESEISEQCIHITLGLVIIY